MSTGRMLEQEIARTDALQKRLDNALAQVAELKKDAERLRWCYGNSIKPLSDMQVHPSQYPTFEEWLVAIDAAKEGE